jgi:hypothetical protein
MDQAVVSDDPVTVRFIDTGEEREVRSRCLRCRRSPDHDGEFNIVSPDGMGHWSKPGAADTTLCGIDATGDRWWHRE